MSNTSQSLASTRINALLDENSFVEVGAYIAARNTDLLKSVDTLQPDQQISTCMKKRPQEMALLPDMVSSTEIWFTFTARTHPF